MYGVLRTLCKKGFYLPFSLAGEKMLSKMLLPTNWRQAPAQIRDFSVILEDFKETHILLEIYHLRWKFPTYLDNIGAKSGG